MTFGKLVFYAQIVGSVLRMLTSQLSQALYSKIHRLTYRRVDSPKHIVIIGGSFAGLELARRLANSVPTGYDIVLVERNSHLHYVFAFPRFSVIHGHEKKAFIPYDGIKARASSGALSIMQNTATGIADGKVYLESGNAIAFEYLVIATGTSQPAPGRLGATNKHDACKELEKNQTAIKEATSIAVFGGGAVGVELAADIKSYHPNKIVALFHSHNKLLNRFDPSLHEKVSKKLNELGVDVILGERHQIPPGFTPSPRDIVLKDGSSRKFDLSVSCIGQTPRSDLLKEFSPKLVDAQGYIRALPTLQVADDCLPHVFSLGDVADTKGPKQARAALFQAQVVADNILRLISDEGSVLKTYQPHFVENALVLTVGKDLDLLLIANESQSMLRPSKGHPDEMDTRRFWKFFGAQWKENEP